MAKQPKIQEINSNSNMSGDNNTIPNFPNPSINVDSDSDSNDEKHTTSPKDKRVGSPNKILQFFKGRNASPLENSKDITNIMLIQAFASSDLINKLQEINQNDFKKILLEYINNPQNNTVILDGQIFHINRNSNDPRDSDDNYNEQGMHYVNYSLTLDQNLAPDNTNTIKARISFSINKSSPANIVTTKQNEPHNDIVSQITEESNTKPDNTNNDVDTQITGENNTDITSDSCCVIL